MDADGLCMPKISAGGRSINRVCSWMDRIGSRTTLMNGESVFVGMGQDRGRVKTFFDNPHRTLWLEGKDLIAY
jgi:hypothetical protein